jgi:hypothetical protein
LGVYTPKAYEENDLDKAIMEILPDEGTKVGKFHDMGKSVRDIRTDLDDNTLSSDIISAALRTMKMFGLVIDKKGRGTGGTRIWQRTIKGKVQYGIGDATAPPDAA